MVMKFGNYGWAAVRAFQPCGVSPTMKSLMPVAFDEVGDQFLIDRMACAKYLHAEAELTGVVFP